MYSGMLIGRSVTIVESSDTSLLNRSGLVIDETKNMIVIEAGSTKSIIMVPKSVVRIKLNNAHSDSLVLAGSELLRTPEERIKG